MKCYECMKRSYCRLLDRKGLTENQKKNLTDCAEFIGDAPEVKKRLKNAEQGVNT